MRWRMRMRKMERAETVGEGVGASWGGLASFQSDGETC